MTTTEHRRKAVLQTAFKAVGEDAGDGTTLAEGEFIATAAVFGNVDSYGDRMVSGAFDDSLAEWKASGNVLSVIYAHDWRDPFANIGEVVWIKEQDGALVYKGRIDMDDAYAVKVYKLMKGRRIVQQSFSYDVLDGQLVKEDGRDIYEISRVKLYEVGPCLVGVNQSTELLDIKSGSGAAGSPAAPEPSGQEKPAADAPSTAPGSTPEASASKGYTPASAQLILEALSIEGMD